MGKHSSDETHVGRKCHQAKHVDTSRQPTANTTRSRKLDALPDSYYDSASDQERGGRYDKR